MDKIEIEKLKFIELASILLEKDPYISFQDLLTEYNVIPASRKKRPDPSYIEECGYRHDGNGNILRKNGKILRHTTNGGTGKKYKVYHLTVPGFGSESSGGRNYCIQGHTLIFALVHRRWPRDGYVLDHIDDNPFNNHPDNLRELTYLENNWHIKDKVKVEKNTIVPNKINETQTTLMDFFS